LTVDFRAVTLDDEMTRTCHPHWSLSVTAAAPLLALLLTAGSACASCGDYLTIGNGPAKHEAPGPAGAPSKDPAQPCNGPWCQTRHHVPLAPPASTQVNSFDDCCCFVPVRMMLATQVEWVKRPDFQPQQLPIIDIFHPPRAATV
jgi:hypothetical protein